jgi:hypothetical protein
MGRPTTTGGVGFGFAFGARFGYEVVGLTERAAGAAAGEPGVDARGVEGVAACQAADVVVFCERVDADGAGIARVGEEFGGDGGVDVVVVVVVVVVFCIAR